MSKVKQVVEIEPTEMDWSFERHVIRGLLCNCCNGVGIKIKGNIEMKCPRCGGSGKLLAVVSINWEEDMSELLQNATSGGR